MEEIGVEAVVKGLSAFLSDTKKLNNAIDGLRPSGTLLQRVFSGLTDTLGSFGREILNVAEYALGHLLADAVQFVISQLGDLARATLDAGAEFQSLELRLQRLNFNSLIQSGMEYGKAQREAISLTKEQLSWITKLAATTPYDATDISNVFTLARSYGFAADAAKGLTEDITNFAAGMGLGNTEIERIIVNFGQMVQQGKVSQREMNDLARGAFVPVNDVITQMRKNVAGLSDTDLKALSTATGISEYNLRHIADTTKSADSSFTELKKTGEGVNLWMQAFSDLVQSRFTGASEAMARTFKGATDNAKDFIKSVVGLNFVKPILDVVGGKIADFVTVFTRTSNMERFKDIVSKLSQQVLDLAGSLFGVEKIDIQAVIERILGALKGLSKWLSTNKGNIVEFFQGIGTAIQTKVVPFILRIVGAFNTIRDWVANNKKTIMNFFGALANIIGKAFNINLGGTSSLSGFLDMIKSFMDWVVTNQDALGTLAEVILKAFLAWQVFATVMGFVMGILISIVGAILSVVSAVAGFLGVFSVVNGILALVGTSLGALIAAMGGVILVILGVVAQVILLISYFQVLPQMIGFAVTTIMGMFTALWENAVTMFNNIIVAIQNHDWAGVGTAIVDAIKNGWSIEFGALADVFINNMLSLQKKFRENTQWKLIGQLIIHGIAAGVLAAAQELATAAANVVSAAIAAARKASGEHSPSTEGIEIGANFVSGVVIGIQQSTAGAVKVMSNAMSAIMAPALAMPAITQQYAVSAPASVNNTNSYTNNWNLNIHSQARTEQVIQDYNMMRALAGA